MGGWLGMAQAQRALGSMPRRAEAYRKALALARTLRDRAAELAALMGLAATAQAGGKAPAAANHYRAALPISRELGLEQAEIATLMGLAALAGQAGATRGGPAASYLTDALSLARKLGDTASEAAAALQLYDAAANEAQRQPALDSMPVALKVSCETDDRAGELLARLALAGHDAPLDPAGAMAGFKRALILADELGDRAAQAEARYGLACLYTASGDRAAAVENDRWALIMLKQVGDKGRELIVLRRLADAEVELGENVEAARHYDQTLSLAREPGRHGCRAGRAVGAGAGGEPAERAEAGGRLLPPRAAAKP